MNQRFFLYISFNGSKYHGWQKQNNAITVQSVIQDSINKFINGQIEIHGAGRTDTGVHAREMVAHVDLFQINIKDFLYRLNSILPNDIKVFKMLPVKNKAHARFDALKRCYKYYFTKEKQPFMLDTSFFYSNSLDFSIMNKACDILINNKDFKSFEKSNSGSNNSLCKIYNIGFEQQKDFTVFNICANRFLRNMVRSLLGTLFLLGENKISLEELNYIIESRNRSNAGNSVPAKGLFLDKIFYPNDIFN